jgi:hypothetical protein
MAPKTREMQVIPKLAGLGAKKPTTWDLATIDVLGTSIAGLPLIFPRIDHPRPSIAPFDS